MLTEINGVYSRNNLLKVKDGTYAVDFDEYELVETHWIALYVNGDNVTYSDSFWVKDISIEIKNS